ncbi:MAG: hypothetical protein HDT39_01375 [Lachnospiraceae bacterium]|nr:hypothetical protein [Lachnospiraceae bacterium]
MAKYTAQQIKILKQNPYTLNVTKNKLYLTKKFKEDFWQHYQMGIAPRKILAEFGYDLSMFGQKQIDSMVQSIKNQALSGNGFSEGSNRQNRMKLADIEAVPKTMEQMQHELLYLRQEVEFLKKIIKADNRKRGN